MSTRRILVREGSRLMRRGGYTDCGLVELLEAAGLPKGSFYHHFGSKERFAIEVVEAFYDWHDVRLEELAGETRKPAVRRLRSYFELLLERAESTPADERGCLLALLALEKSATSAGLREALAVAFARWQERVAELVRQAQAEGAVDPSLPAEQVAGLLLHGWEGALMRARLDRDTAPLVDFLKLGLPRLLA